MLIPSLLLKKLYTLGSLKNTPQASSSPLRTV